jgi:peptidoglycan/LPS O-acetylase OafA/YrhL
VLAYHGGVKEASGGFLGVDAFFVLSGYLITTLLMTEWQRTGTIVLAAFWARRARRLLPALLVMVVTVAISARALLPPDEVRLLRGDGLAAIFYVANWRMIFRGSGYFAQTAAPSPLQHTWSLGIEEQFYILWPLLLLVVLAGRKPLRRLILVCSAAAVVSALMMAVLYRVDDPDRAYYGTDTRAASLLIGAALAALLATRGHDEAQSPRRSGRPILGAMALLGAAVTAYAWTTSSGGDPFLYQGGMVVAALAVAAILAHIALVPQGLPSRILSLPPLPALGRISYGVYLWHWPVFIAANAARTGQRGMQLFALRCLITLGIAAASYVVVERPFRSGAVTRHRLVALTCAGSGLAVTVALVVVATAVPSPSRQRAIGPSGIGGRRVSTLISAPATLAAESARPNPRLPVHHRRSGRPVRVDVFGDSVAWSLVAYMPRYQGIEFRDHTTLGCGVTRTAPYVYFGQTYPRLPRGCRSWPRRWRHGIDTDNPDVALVLVGRWETMNRTLNGRWTHVGEPHFDAHLRTQLELAISVAGSRGAQVILATEPYNQRGEQPDGSLWPEDQPQRVTAWNRLLRDVAAENPEVKVIDFGARVSPEGRFTWDAGGVQVRADGLHLTPIGVQRWIAPWLVRQLLADAPN